ncbi:TauD/TfdA family dioxygenase [Actinophytocola sediminis]
MVVPGVDGTHRRAVRLLADTSAALARRGATAQTTFAEFLDEVPAELVDALTPLVPLPDRTTGYRVIPGLLDVRDAGPTPASWGAERGIDAHALDIAVLLAGAVIGQVIGWAGQQDGRLVHDIVPSRGSEHLQVGASSLTSLEWHTEDSFHPDRAALLLLACVRNPTGTGSRVASVRETTLSAAQLAHLRRQAVTILPDDSYPATAKSTSDSGVMTVWDAEDGLCLRYDPSYTTVLRADPEFTSAYRALGEQLEACSRTVPVGPGDLLLIDNDVAVHGRAPFVPRYDGTDRWLKRVLIHLPRPRPAYERLEDGFGQRPIGPHPAGAR